MTTTAVSAPPSLRRLVAPLSGLILAQFGAGLSGTVVATSIPTLMADLDGPEAHATWLVAATILTNAATTPIWGKLGDLFNPKTVLLAAIGFFIVSVGFAVFAINTTMLIAARALMGVGFGGIFALVTITVASLVSARERGRVNGWLSITMTIAQLSAPVLGGILATAPLLGWRWSFIAIFPLALGALVLIIFTLKLDVRAAAHARPDYAGAVLIGLAVTSAMLCVTTLGDSGWTDPLVLVTAPLTVVLLITVVIVERRANDPIVPFALLRGRVPALAVLGAFFAGSTMFTGTVFTSEYLQIALGLDPAVSGALLIPMALSTAIAAWGVGRYMSRTGKIKPVLVIGYSSLVLGSTLLVMIGLAPIPLAIGGTVFVASGLGMVMQNIVLAAQNSVDHEHVGTVSASVMFFLTLGGAIVLISSGALLNALVHSAMDAGATRPEAYSTSIPWVFGITAVFVTLGLISVLAMPRMRLRETL